MSGFLLLDLLEGRSHLFGIFRIARANAPFEWLSLGGESFLFPCASAFSQSLYSGSSVAKPVAPAILSPVSRS
jgi:hypothetical protein